MTPPELQIFVSAAPDRPFYKRDVLNACCAPTGDHLTLAFANRWISPQTSALIGTNAQATPALSVLLIFCEFRGAGSGNDIFRFHPFRRATLTGRTLGENAVTFELELAGFVTLRDTMDKLKDKL